ncbi:MAG: GTP-binding protein, partial [Agrobacterium sp.]|nr:GTP-binding protein [Agrobacterium sp.]
MSRDRIPVSIITGFLGAGKSTLLNRLLKDPDMSDAAIIINEFGDVSIDHMLVESAGEGIIELAEGCLCCTVRGELVDTLAELMDGIQTGKLKPVKRVVIETTGLADPAPVMQSIMGNPVIAQNFVLNGMITVVDAVNGLSTLDNHEEAVKQAAVADRLVMTKRALADAAAISALAARLQALNPRATIEDGDKTEWSAAGLLDNGLYDAGSKNADVGRWLGEEAEHDHGHEHGHHHHHHGDHDDHHHHDVNRHDASIRSFSIIHDQPINPM